LESESQRLSELAVAPGGGHLAMELAMEALQEAATENRSASGWVGESGGFGGPRCLHF